MFNNQYSPTPRRWRTARAIVCGLLPVLLLHTQGRAQEKDLVFHFDFTHAQGKTELQDQTKRFKSRSQVGPFAIENNALRIAEGAKIMIRSSLPSACGWLKAISAIPHRCSSKANTPSRFSFPFP
jgi:hypothetical protein